MPFPDAQPGDPPDPVWINRFFKLGDVFWTAVSASALPAPYWVARNRSLAQGLGLDDWLDTSQALQAMAGNQPLPGSTPLATVYGGHQFGHWAGQLGDGRALLLGEIETPIGSQELQLKGAGLTPYSRMGDGRAVLRSSIREYLCSEAMHALGIPTTRALCLTGSDAPVRRETMETAAVLTRVAPSFIRFGHFEHFSYLGQHDELKTLADFVIDHHYPSCRGADGADANPYAALLEAVSERTAHLVAQWQSVGFCHGVMNTDNMSILGLTLDYGPFQFLDHFDPHHICNHSDTQGRYAYNRQPNIAYWNLFCLGQALLPLIGAQEPALAALASYKTVFPAALESRMLAKLGLNALPERQQQDRDQVEGILKLLAQDRVDYTIFWRRLSHAVASMQNAASPPAALAPVRDLFLDREGFDAWMLSYSERLTSENMGTAAQTMLKNNPKYVLRNHLGELAIQAAKLKDFSVLYQLQTLLQTPYDEHPEHEAHAGFPPDWAASIEISCSS